jgi:hypothetical protein
MPGVMHEQSQDGGAYAQQHHSEREHLYKNTEEGCLTQRETDEEHETSTCHQSRPEKHEWVNQIGYES